MDVDLIYEPEPPARSSSQSVSPPLLAPDKLAKARIGTYLCFWINGCAMAAWISRIVFVKHALSLTDGQLGIALFALAAGALIGFPLAGYTCARFGSKFATLSLGLAYGVSLATICVANSLVSLMAVLVGFGVFHGAMDVAMNANAVEVEAVFGRSIMSSFHGMYSFGALVGAFSGMAFTGLNVATWLHLLIFAALVVIALAIAAGLMFGAKPTGHLDHPIFALPSKPLIAIGIVVTCSFLCEGAMGDWSGVYLRDTLKTSKDFAVAGFVVYSLMMTLARFAGDRVLTKWGPVQVLRVAGSIASVGFACALIVGNPIFALAGFACVGLGMSTIAPIGFGAAGRTKGMASGSAIAAVASMGYTGFLVGPPVIGLIAEHIGLRLALAIVAILAGVIVALAGAAAPAK